MAVSKPQSTTYPSHGNDIGPSFADTRDFSDADRGFIDSLKPCVIRNAQGRKVWDNDEYSFVHAQEAPPTVDARLWRQAQLLSKQGLYRLTPSIYQVRGFDISHITFVEGDMGVIVIDPLVSCECAAAALAFYQQHRPVRQIKAVVYTHSHIDHYGGAAGLFAGSDDDAVPEGIKIIAPEGFMEEALSENVLAGPIMRKRAAHMYGAFLPRSPAGQVGVGLGMGTSQGKTSLLPPTTIITHTSQSLVIDGVKIVFQLVPNTEAPSEMNIYFPQEQALLIAECATHALHNIVTLRGALVRDAKAWATYLDQSLFMFTSPAAKSEVLFASHGWPTWGEDNVQRFIGEQRDLYAFLHDQTIRLMNHGLNGTEIAERLVLPPNLRRAWHAQGFYGSISHNVKGIYQRYMTWFDGKAENLWKLPPAEEGSRYVECMGGAEQTLEKARQFIFKGNLRFAATLLGHLVAADDVDSQKIQSQSRKVLSQVFIRLGHGSENATWRNIYLSQAAELGEDHLSRNQRSPPQASFPSQLSIEQWLSGLSVNIDGELAGEEVPYPISIGIDVTDIKEIWLLILSNGALTYRRCRDTALADAGLLDLALALTKGALQDLLTEKEDRARFQILKGDYGALGKLLSFAGIRIGSQNTISHL
ncbi:hypothetical protein LTS17_009586 [Exophiala oligosperma]